VTCLCLSLWRSRRSMRAISSKTFYAP
jgi:hypothetical protein